MLDRSLARQYMSRHMPVNSVPSLGWTRRSAAISVLLVFEEQRKRAGERVVALREGRNWSQEDLAAKSGLSVKTISRFENGRHEGRNETVRKLAKAFRVNEVDITGPPVAPLGLDGLPEARPANGQDDLADRLDAIEQALADARAERQEHAANIEKLLKRQDDILDRIEKAIAREEQAAKTLATEGERWVERVHALARQEFAADAQTREEAHGTRAT